MDIALDHLTEAEQDAIYAVLRRDDQLRTKDHERIRQLQNDVKKIKLAGVIKPGIDANKTCARCRKEFGWIFDKGQVCVKCQHKVCENCKVIPKEGQWLCVLCSKQREMEAMSGQWFFRKFRKSKRNKKTNQVISGNEIIRASIRKKPGLPRHGGRMRNADFELRHSGKRAVSPSSLVLGSDGAGEDSDTQSTEMGPTFQRQNSKRPDLAFPKDSDQARLQNLITGGTLAASQQTTTRKVISVGGMGHDSSSSESEPGSPTLPKSKAPFSHDDSIHSSGRSASPVSAISSEGHMTMVTERDISDIESLRSAISGFEDFDLKRSSELQRTEPAPPRRLAKTAEQERLEALQEKSQEDLADYSDSDGLVPPSRVKPSPDVGGAPPVVANNPYNRLRATNPLHSTHTDPSLESLAFNTAMHAALASTVHKKSPNSGIHPTKTPASTLTDATIHADKIKNTPMPQLHKHQHPQASVKSNQHSLQTSNSSAKCQAFMEASDIDVMYQHYAMDLRGSGSSTSSESDVESQDGYSLTSRDADVESLDSHKESQESHTPRESLEFVTPRGSMEFHSPGESLDIPSELDPKDPKIQQEFFMAPYSSAKGDSKPQDSNVVQSSLTRPLKVEIPPHIPQSVQLLSSSSSSTDSSVDDMTASSPSWHPAWTAAVAAHPLSKHTTKTSSRDHVDHAFDFSSKSNTQAEQTQQKYNTAFPQPTFKVFNPFDVIVDDDVKYTSDQVHKGTNNRNSMNCEEDPGWEDIRESDAMFNPEAKGFTLSEHLSPKNKSPKSPRSEHREANFLDDDDVFSDEILSSLPVSRTTPYLPSYWEVVAHTEDDDRVSDTLSVITELTEPIDSDKSFSDDETPFNKSIDNTVMEVVEFKMLNVHSPREQGLPNTNKAWLKSQRSMSLTSTLAYNECLAVSGDSDVASLTDLVRANQDDIDLDFTTVYELNSSVSNNTNRTHESNKMAGPATFPFIEVNRVENLETVPPQADASSEDSPTSVKDAVKSWESKRSQNNGSYLGNEIDWSEVYEIDMVEEEEEDDTKLNVSGSSLPTLLGVPGVEERNMKRSGAEVMSEETNAKVFKVGAELVDESSNDVSQHSLNKKNITMIAGHPSVSGDASLSETSQHSSIQNTPPLVHRPMHVNGDVTPTNSASSSDSVLTPSQSETVAAQQEALQELRANISIALQRLSDSPHDEEFQFDRYSDDEREHRKLVVTPENDDTSPKVERRDIVMMSMNRNSLDELAEENERIAPRPVKLREQLLKNANRSTLDYLAEENEMEEEKEIDLDDIIQENTNEMVANESAPSNVAVFTSVAVAHNRESYINHASPASSPEMVTKSVALALSAETDSDLNIETDEEASHDFYESIVEAKEIPVSLPNVYTSFDWEKLDQDSPVTEVEPDRDEDIQVKKDHDADIEVKTDSEEEGRIVETVVVTTEVITHETNTVVKRQPSDSSDSFKGSRHRKMYVLDTDEKVVVPGLNSDEESDSLNELSSSNRSSTIASGDSDPQVVKEDDSVTHLPHDADTIIAPADDTANLYTATNSDTKSQAPNFLTMVQNRFGFGPDDDSQKKAVTFNPYTEEYSDQSDNSEISPDNSMFEPVSGVRVAVLSEDILQKEIGSDDDAENKNDSDDDVDDLPKQNEIIESLEDDGSGKPEEPIHHDHISPVAAVIVSQNILTKANDSDSDSYEKPERKESGHSLESDSSRSDREADLNDTEDQFETKIKSDSQSSLSNPELYINSEDASKTESDSGHQLEPRMKSDSQTSVGELSNSELHDNSDTASKSDYESDSGHISERPAGHGRVLVRQDIYVESDSDVNDLSKSDSRESEGVEECTEAPVDTGSDHDESVSAGAVLVGTVVQQSSEDTTSYKSAQSDDVDDIKEESQTVEGQMDEFAKAILARAMRDAGWDESSEGWVRYPVPDSPGVSVEDEPSANRVRGDSALSEGNLSMSSSELTNLAPPTTSPSDSMAQEDRVDNASSSETNGAVMPAVAVTAAAQDGSLERKSKTSAVSDTSSLVEPHFDDEDEEDIDELFTSGLMNRSITNLSSTYSESRESIASYYSDAGEGSKYPVTGDLEFSTSYNYKTGIFEVHVKKCRNIAAVDAKRKRTDAYVKVYLLPDKSKSGKRKTKVKKHTLNPVFDEILRYSIHKSELESRTLSLSVWHNDRFGRNDFLGEVSFPLDNVNVDALKPTWHPLLDRVAPVSPTSMVTYKGDLLISIKFEQDDPQKPGTLHILVKEARNLTPKDNGVCDPFCKGYLLPDKSSKQSKQKTAVKKKTVNPTWDQNLTFPGLSLSDLSQRSLELTVWDHDRFNRNDYLGGVRLNLGTGKSEGQDVDWMDAKGEEISLWQSMLHRPNVWIDSNLMLRASMDKRL